MGKRTPFHKRVKLLLLAIICQTAIIWSENEIEVKQEKLLYTINLKLSPTYIYYKSSFLFRLL